MVSAPDLNRESLMLPSSLSCWLLTSHIHFVREASTEFLFISIQILHCFSWVCNIPRVKVDTSCSTFSYCHDHQSSLMHVFHSTHELSL